MKLRPYQSETISRLRSELGSLPKPDRKIVCQMATGAGKTFTAAELISMAEANGKRTLFICDTLELVEQALKSFDQYGLSVGVIQSQHQRTNFQRLTQVCSQATLNGLIKSGRLDGYKVDLIIHDECHVIYKVRDELSKLYPDAPVIGLTATPFTKGLGNYYQSVVSSVSMVELINNGFLCPFTVYAPYVPDMKGTALQAGDYKKASSAEKYDGAIVADIVKTWKQHGKGRRTLMFACNVAHSKSMVQAFVDAGVNAVHVDGYGGSDEIKAERFQTIQDYRDGKIEVLSNVALCTKGFDSPETSCLIIARPTKSLSLHWQIFGRGMRTAPGKKDCIILDHAGNTVRHGFPTDIMEFKLNDGTRKEASTDARKKGEKLPIPCPSCSGMKPAGMHVCPFCQFAPEKQAGVVNVDGELIPIGQVEAKAVPKKMLNPTTGKRYTNKFLEDWMRMFKHYEIANSKKNGFSIYLYRDCFGEDPKKKWPSKTIEPTPRCLDWIKRRNKHYAIKHAKGRAHAA